jgi:hypothetical protein
MRISVVSCDSVNRAYDCRHLFEICRSTYAGQIRPCDIVVAAVMADCTDGYFGLLATSFKARGARAYHLCRSPRLARPDRDEVPGLEQGDLRQGNSKSDAGLGEDSHCVRRCPGQRAMSSSRTTMVWSSFRQVSWSSWREAPIVATIQQFAVGSIFSSPLVVGGVVYFGSTDGNMYAVE